MATEKIDVKAEAERIARMYAVDYPCYRGLLEATMGFASRVRDEAAREQTDSFRQFVDAAVEVATTLRNYGRESESASTWDRVETILRLAPQFKEKP